jgi:hypothetical protein
MLVVFFFLCVLGDDLLLDVGRDQLVMAERHRVAAASAGATKVGTDFRARCKPGQLSMHFADQADLPPFALVRRVAMIR